MKKFSFILPIVLATILIARVSVVRSHKFVIDCNFLNDKLLPAVGLGSGNARAGTDFNGNPNKDQWDDKQQFEGVGLARAIFLKLENTIPNIRGLTKEDKTKIVLLFVGGFGGNSLGGWVAAAILSEFGITCKLYVIKNEKVVSDPKGATEHSINLLKMMYHNYLLNQNGSGQGKQFVNIQFVNGNPFEPLTDPVGMDKLKTALGSDPENDETIKAIVALVNNKETRISREVEEQIVSNIATFNLVVDCLTGASKTPGEFKIGGFLALLILQAASGLNLFSNDIPSLWNPDTGAAMPAVYVQLGIKALKPAGNAHAGALKAFIADPDCKDMDHWVVIPGPLKDALDEQHVKSLVNHPNFKLGPKTAMKITQDPAAVTDTTIFYVEVQYTEIVVRIDTSKLAAVTQAKVQGLTQIGPQVGTGASVLNPFATYVVDVAAAA